VPFEVSTYDALAGLVRNGLGVAFLPASGARALGDRHPVDLKDVALTLQRRRVVGFPRPPEPYWKT
jgi:DNA-binding transcriptional LysR family regulator